MIYEEQASGSILSEIKFDRIIFMNSWHQIMVPEQIVGVDVQLFLKRYDYNIFSHTQQVLDKTLSQKAFSH